MSREDGRDPTLFNQRTTMRWIADVHEFWYRLTNGLVGGYVFSARILLLTTSGRKTGRRYTKPLLYIEDSDAFIVIASNSGADRDPHWWRNLRAQPSAKVQIGGKHLDVRAEAATGEERARLWEMITSRYRVYLVDKRRTKREIPVVVLRRQSVRTEIYVTRMAQ